ncbi:MAG: ThiF family adenylyltransferase, partial [Catonella sp.]
MERKDMEESQFSRTELLLGEKSVEKLAKKRIAVFGVGGVGGFVCEGLVRAGIGEIDIIDKDTVAVSNLNRQLIALHST